MKKILRRQSTPTKNFYASHLEERKYSVLRPMFVVPMVACREVWNKITFKLFIKTYSQNEYIRF